MSELKKGTDHEMEHTSSRKVAKKIATDHLKEKPDYYTRLDKCMKEEVSGRSVAKAIMEARGAKKHGIHKEIRGLVSKHDLTHEMSDDPDSYREGRKELADIEKKAKRIPKKNFARIWNKEADKKVAKPDNKMFHKEDTDLTEVSKALMGRYVDKARWDLKMQSKMAGVHTPHNLNLSKDAQKVRKEVSDSHDQKAEKRTKGIGLVARKLMREKD